MKFTVLPSFHLKADKQELNYRHNAFYNGNNSRLAFLFNHTLYPIIFFIPLIGLLFFMFHFGYAPFGENSMFTLDGAYRNLPVLTSTIHDIQQGNFHLFTLKGTTGSEFYSSIAYYLASPLTLICLFFDQETAVGLLSVFSVLRIAGSGVVFFHYLTHRPSSHTDQLYNPMMVVFSLGYSLSAFAMVQYNDFMFLDHFMLFPLLMLYLEHFTHRGTCCRKFIALNTFLLLSNFYMGIILNLFIILFYFYQSRVSLSDTILRFFKLAGMILLSCLLSAITVIPGMYSFIQNCHTSSSKLNGTLPQADFFYVFLNHLFFADPSYQRVGTSGVNLYFGMFGLILVFLYFWNKKFSIRRRIATAVLWLFLFLSFSTQQLNYYFSLCYLNTSSFTAFVFVYLFFLLTLGTEILPYIRTISLKGILCSTALPVFLALLCINYTSVKPNYNSVYYSVALLIIYGLILVFYRIGSIKRDSYYCLVLCIFCLEILANAFQLTYVNSQNQTLVSDVIVTDGPTVAESDDFTRAEYYHNIESAYQSNLISRRSFNTLLTNGNTDSTYTPLENSLACIQYVYADATQSADALLASQYKEVTRTDTHTIYENQTPFPAAFSLSGILSDADMDNSTFITRQNSIARALGSSSDLYTEDTSMEMQLSLPEDAGFSCHSLGNNVFLLEAQPDEDKPSNANATLSFTASQSGDLFLLVEGIPTYYGQVEAGEEYSYTFPVTVSQDYDMNIWLQAFYYHPQVMEELSSSLEQSSCFIRYIDKTTVEILVDSTEETTVLSILPYLPEVVVKTETGEKLSPFSYNNQLAVKLPAGTHKIQIEYRYPPFTLGLILSIVTAMLCILPLFSRGFLAFLQKCQKALSDRLHSAIPSLLLQIKDNGIYILAFLIPFSFFLLIMLYNTCEPFGILTLFNGDGLSIVLPQYSFFSQMLKEGFPSHSWYAGNGFNTSSILCGSIMNFIYYFIPQSEVIRATTFILLTTLCLAGPSMVFYLTHRLTGKRAHKKDIRLLIPAMCYTLCNYMLMMINNTSWYYAFALLPLLLLGMDYLMVRNKSRYYMLMLGLSLLADYYMTMFICFYLVMRFFTYRFTGFRDFIRKGIRFALSSLATAGLSFLTLFFALTGLRGNTYGTDDAVFPASYFFNGFDYLFNRQGILSETFLISWNEGNANLYFGILPLLLMAIYLLQKKIPLKEKLGLLIPYGIFFLSLNYSVLSYFINGMHYQHGVPSRYVFLLAMMASFISYDCIRLWAQIPRKKVILSAFGVALVFILSFLVTEKEERNLPSFITTLVCIVIYCIILCKPFRRKFSLKKLNYALVMLFGLELFINSAYQVTLILGAPYFVEYNTPALEYTRRDLDMENSLERVAVVSPLTDNYGLANKTKTNPQFSTMLTGQQITLCHYQGLYTAPNATLCDNSQTPMGYAIGNNRYILLHQYGLTKNTKDLKYFTPIALQKNNIIFKNDNYFPFAYYLPASAKQLIDIPLNLSDMWNILGYTFLRIDEPITQTIHLPYRKEVADTGNPEGNYFLASVNKTNENVQDCIIHATATESGSYYSSFANFQYLGDYQEGDTIDLIVDEQTFQIENLNSGSTLYVFNRDLITALCKKVNENAFVVTDFTDESIRGSIDMPEDGYVNFTMPYDKYWKVEIDGKPTRSYAMADGFLAVEATKGSHEITLTYEDNRIIPAVTITVISWLLFALGCYITDRYRAGKVVATVDSTENDMVENSDAF